MFTERTSIGLDVHARSVVAAAIDGVTGEVTRARLTIKAEGYDKFLAGRSERQRWALTPRTSRNTA